MLECLVGHDEKDSTSVIDGMERLINESNGKGFDCNLDVSGVSIGIPIEYEQELINSINDGSKYVGEVLNLWQEMVKLLREKGAVIKRINLPHSKYVGATYLIINSAEVASNFSCYDGIEFGNRANEYINEEGQVIKFKTAGQLFQESREVFGTNVKSRILAGNYFLLTRNQENYLKHAMKVRRLIYQDFQNVFKWWKSEEKDGNYMRVNYHLRDTVDTGMRSNESVGGSDCGSNRELKDRQNDKHVDFILTPATLRSAVKVSEWRKRIDNQQQAMKEDYFLTGANLAGLPAVTFPVKLSSEGLPLSLQLIGNHFTDFRLLSLVNSIQSTVKFPFLNFNDDMTGN